MTACLILLACPQSVGTTNLDSSSAQDAGVSVDAAPDAMTDANPKDADPIDAGVEDSGAPDADPVDSGAPDAGEPDSGEPACIIDPFLTCNDPTETSPNNAWHDATSFHSSAGCQTGDDVSPIDHTVSAVICQTEPADFYSQMLVECDTHTLLAEIRLHLTTGCDPTKYQLVFFRGGGRVDCNSGILSINCTENNGDSIIQLQVPPGRSLQSWQFGVESDHTDVQFDYDLTLRVW